jgi:hypothetical protein
MVFRGFTFFAMRIYTPRINNLKHYSIVVVRIKNCIQFATILVLDNIDIGVF